MLQSALGRELCDPLIFCKDPLLNMRKHEKEFCKCRKMSREYLVPCFFLNKQGMSPNEYYEICHTYRHSHRLYPILKNYSNVPNNMLYEFFGSPIHHTNQCRALDALTNPLDCTTFWVNEFSHGRGGTIHRGKMTGRIGLVRCYKYDQ